MRTLFNENFLKVWLKSASNEGPIKSITRTLYSPGIRERVTFSGAVVNVGDSLVDDCGVVVEVVVEFAFVNQLRVVSSGRFNFYCNFQVGLGVDGLVDLSESSLVDLPDDLEVFSHLLKHLRHSHSVINN